MSAFIVSKTHVAALIRYYQNHRWGKHAAAEPGACERMAGVLYAENVRSVNHRYADHTPDEPTAFTLREIMRAPILSAVQAIKACNCLEYQSCETDNWMETEACRLLNSIKGAAETSLPGYDGAAWEIDEATDQKRAS